MLQKNAKKSNTPRIGIFEGKSATYNQHILEVLWEQDRPLTSWEIAKGVEQKRKSTKDKEKRGYRIRNIYSVIQRSGGRLEDLENKHYIIRDNGKWRLNWWKGRMAIFIKNPQLLDNLSREPVHQAFALVRTRLKTPTDSDLALPFGMTLKVNGVAFRKDFDRLLRKLEKDPSFIRLLVDETMQLVSEGIDLDMITDESLVTLLCLRKCVKNYCRNLL